jgi:hypothetical protein
MKFKEGDIMNLIIPHNDYRVEKYEIVSKREENWIVKRVANVPEYYEISPEYISYCNDESEKMADGYIDAKEYMPEFNESILIAMGKPPYTYNVAKLEIKKAPVQNISSGKIVGAVYIRGSEMPISCSKLYFWLLPQNMSAVNIKDGHKIPEFETVPFEEADSTDVLATMERPELLNLAKEAGVKGKLITYKTNELRDKIRKKLEVEE